MSGDLSESALLQARIDALEQLLEVYEQTSVDQAAKLANALDALREKSAALVAVEQDRTHLAQEHAKRLEEEMDVAVRIQTSVLPRETRVAGYEIAATVRPAERAAGDYYDVIPVEDGCWVAIADVSGHGLNAGLVMLMVQSATLALVRQQPTADPRVVLCGINRALFENVRRRLQIDDFVTMSLLRLYRDGRFVFAGAHEDILVRRATTGECESFHTPGTWLAVIESIEDATLDSSNRLRERDTIVLHTDGITEARHAGGEVFGIHRLHEALCKGGESAEGIRDHILRAVDDFTAEQEDDQTLVVLRYIPGG